MNLNQLWYEALEEVDKWLEANPEERENIAPFPSLDLDPNEVAPSTEILPQENDDLGTHVIVSGGEVLEI